MKKHFILILIACFAIAGQVMAALPVTPSTDTGEGAHWYRIKNLRAAGGGRGAYIKAADYDAEAVMDYADNSDHFLWCFVGDETSGFQVYNKALLNNGARLITVDNGTMGDWGAIKVVSSETAWTYSWSIKNDDGYYGIVSGMPVKGNVYIHGMNDFHIIFYGNTAKEGGCAWAFEDATIPITVDFSTLIAVINEYTAKVDADKADPTTAEEYAEVIALFETAIATAQAVVDNPAATQLNVSVAIDVLKKANNEYRLGFIALPFTISEGENWAWYKIHNERRAVDGYLTYGNNVLETTAEANSDNQLWAFKGNNNTGIHIYNKANLVNGGELIYANGVFTISSTSWSGVWKVDRKIDGGFYYYGICNTKGVYDGEYVPNDFFHGTLTGGIVLYGFGDPGSSWNFIATSANSINTPGGLGAVSIFARDGVIYVNGATGTVSVFSITGKNVGAFDAGKPYTIKEKGIYIVRVNGKAFKVMVQ
jgi:uncharacterized protein YjhX (UPF0386 family)